MYGDETAIIMLKWLGMTLKNYWFGSQAHGIVQPLVKIFCLPISTSNLDFENRTGKTSSLYIEQAMAWTTEE